MWYGCYIDDLIIVWDGDVAPKPHLFEYANTNSLNLRFTGNFSRDSVHYLDLTLQGNPIDVCVNSKLYRKPNSGNSVLNASSCHPQCTIRSIPVGEYTRTKRACSDQTSYNAAISDLNARLISRGYDARSLKKADNKMHNKTRESLLFQSKKRIRQTN